MQIKSIRYVFKRIKLYLPPPYKFSHTFLLIQLKYIQIHLTLSRFNAKLPYCHNFYNMKYLHQVGNCNCYKLAYRLIVFRILGNNDCLDCCFRHSFGKLFLQIKFRHNPYKSCLIFLLHFYI